MEQAILILLAQHGSLAADQIAAQLQHGVDDVQQALRRLRADGLVDVLAVGELVGHSTTAAAYWSITDAGRDAVRA